jgi:hypothetical protein
MSLTTNRFPFAGGALKHLILLSWSSIVGCLICFTNALADGTRQPLPSLPDARPPLKPAAFIELPLKAVTPVGWLQRQLQIQADGLTGHLDEFWPDVGPQSGGLGGPGESWERKPYFLDGLLPLAHLLNDKNLLKKANDRIEWAFRSQQANGQFGPVSKVDWWPSSSCPMARPGLALPPFLWPNQTARSSRLSSCLKSASDFAIVI